MSRESILIVEPEPSVRESLRLILRDEYEVETTETFQQAGELLKTRDFHLVIVDLDENDLAPLTDLMSRNENSPVMVVSSLRDVELIVNAMKMGVVDFIAKPFDVESLRESVDKAIQKSRETASLISPGEEREMLVDSMIFRGYYYYLDAVRNFDSAACLADDTNALAQTIIRSVSGSLGVSQCMVFVPEGDKFALKSYSSVHDNLSDVARVPRDHPMFVPMKREKRVIFERELRGLMAAQDREILAKLNGFRVYVYAPMFSGDELMGAIVVGDKLNGMRFVEGELDLLMTLALRAGSAVRRIVAQNRTQEWNHYLSEMLDNIGSGVIATDPEGIMLIFNSYSSKLTGFSSSEALGAPVSLLGDEFAGVINRTFAIGDSVKRVETVIRSHDGTEIPIGMNISVLKTPDGKKAGAAVIFTDLSHVQRIEGRRRLSDKMEIWSAVAAEIEHLFRNPLVSVKTLAQLLPEKYDDQEFRTKFYQLVKDDIDKMGKLVEEFTAFSHEMHLMKSKSDLNRLLLSVVQRIRGQMGEAQLQLEIDEKVSIPVNVDVKLFTKALEYAIINCIEDLDIDRKTIFLKTGTVSDIWSNTRKALIEIRYERIEDYVRPLKGAGTINFSIAERIISEHDGLIYMGEDENRQILIRLELPMGDDDAASS